MTSSTCDSILKERTGFSKVCLYYYTPKCVSASALCGSEPDTQNAFCSNGVSQLETDDPYYQGYCYRTPMAGYVPDSNTTASRPAYLHHVGSGEDCTHVTVQHYLDGMTDRGFAAFCVHYPRSGLFQYIGGWFDQKAQWIYSQTNPLNAINIVCAQPRVDCELGIAVHGFSQGAHIASLSKKYEPRVTGILLFGAGCLARVPFAPGFASRGLIYDHAQAKSNLSGASCWWSGKPTSTHPTQTQQSLYRTRDLVRVIAGNNDDIFDAQNQMAYVTGYNCGGNTQCIQADGSGYYLVRIFENTMGNQDGHDFFGLGSNAMTSDYQHGTAPWSMNPNLDWLARKANGTSMSEYDYTVLGTTANAGSDCWPHYPKGDCADIYRSHIAFCNAGSSFSADSPPTGCCCRNNHPDVGCNNYVGDDFAHQCRTCDYGTSGVIPPAALTTCVEAATHRASPPSPV